MTNDGRVSWVTPVYPCELIVHSVIAAPALGRAYTTLLLYDMPDDWWSCQRDCLHIFSEEPPPRPFLKLLLARPPNINEAFSRHKPPFFTTLMLLSSHASRKKGAKLWKLPKFYKENLFLAKRPPLTWWLAGDKKNVQYIAKEKICGFSASNVVTFITRMTY